MELKFYHHNKQIIVPYGYGTGGAITVVLPVNTLELYEYDIDVVINGLSVYEYVYTGT